jgi:biotin synthase-like enzyme
MSSASIWSALADTALAGEAVTRDQARAVLHAPADELLGLLDAAFRVRREHWGRRVSLRERNIKEEGEKVGEKEK